MHIFIDVQVSGYQVFNFTLLGCYGGAIDRFVFYDIS